jgi:flagellar assembly protein FliH
MATQTPETASPPLAEAEIARLVKAAGNVAYQPGSDVPQARQGPFRPRSLLDIVRTVEPDDAPAAPEMAHDLAALTAGSSAADELLPENPGPDHGGEGDATATPAAPHGGPASGMANVARDAGPAALTPQEQGRRNAAQPAAQQDGAARAAEIAAEIAAAREAGRREGAAETRAALAAETAAAVAALEEAAAAFLAPPAKALRALQDQIAAAVLALASARAGSRIDELPAPLLLRIEAIANRVQAATQGAVLRLHPDDCAAIAPLIAGSELLSEARLVPRQDLARGDVELLLGGLLLSDRLGHDPATSEDAP